MNLLALDTATEACSVALQTDDGVYHRWAEAPREHGDRVLAMIDAVLAEAAIARADIDLLVFGRGPGAFTGVRIATGLIQGIASGLDRPVVGVSTLVALAQGVHRRHGHEHVLAALDARMGEVYWGACALDDDGVMTPQGEECVVAPASVPLPPGNTSWVGAGTGWQQYPEVLCQRIDMDAGSNLGRTLPEARDLLPAAARAWQNGEAVVAAEALPVYLRDRVATPSR